MSNSIFFQHLLVAVHSEFGLKMKTREKRMRTTAISKHKTVRKENNRELITIVTASISV